MGTIPGSLDPSYLREQTLGNCFSFETPFGRRLMTYADYTASGRNLRFVEKYLLAIEEAYANTHTEDDVTGKSTTELVHTAEKRIKELVNGNERTRLIAVGTGATGAINKLQQILGIYIPPATRDRMEQYLIAIRDHADGAARASVEYTIEQMQNWLIQRQPVVFVGPYEHHSNEVTWRECMATVVVIDLDAEGSVDLAKLERAVSDPAWEGRLKIGSFSAASNVTGMITPVYEIARIMHRHGGIVCYDFAASGPYVEIDMNRDAESYFDAVFLSPHKFLGGPGSSGLLLFRDSLYRSDLPPTCGGGGTVDYVSPFGHDYTADIEQREKPGTPGSLQLIKAALAMDIKADVGIERIEEIEQAWLRRALDRWLAHPAIEILGNTDPGRRIAIVSFNIRHGERYLHPKFVTRLLNDLFGLQTRAGCSCAGPYGHKLLGIGDELSRRYRAQVLKGINGIKPGWTRLGFHYTMDEADVDFITEAVLFIAEHGANFLPLYRFDLRSGAWQHVDENMDENPVARYGVDEAMRERDITLESSRTCDRQREYDQYLNHARALAEKLANADVTYVSLTADIEPLKFFEIVHLGK